MEQAEKDGLIATQGHGVVWARLMFRLMSGFMVSVDVRVS